MKKRLCIIPAALFFLSTSGLNATKYKFDYDLISDIRKTYVLFLKFRLYYHASASAYFTSWKCSDGVQKFRFAGLPESGYRIRTHRRGSKLSVVTAAYSFANAKAAYSKRIASFRSETPFYSRMIKTIAKRPFKILPTSSRSILFNRYPDGNYGDYGFNLKMIKPANMKRYNDSFNIYRLLLEMVKMMSHKALPGPNIRSLPEIGSSWKSPQLNFGKAIARISYLADHKGKKYFKYRQKRSFRMTYRVLSRRNGRIIIDGTGSPRVSIGVSMKIQRINRKIVIRQRDGMLISERFQMSAKNQDNLGWIFRSRLQLL